MKKVIFLRHGESIWNKENRFTGWADVDLSEKGVQEAKKAGKLLLSEGIHPSIAFCSVLRRAVKTLWLLLEEMELMWIPQKCSWQLNERHYGALQGLNKREVADKHGDEQVLEWRRSYDTRPPSLDRDDQRSSHHDRKYENIGKENIPSTESLKDTIQRMVPHWQKVIVPSILSQETVLMVAHGNTIRALVKHLDKISEKDISKLNIPTGVPLVYEVDTNVKPIRSYYLGIDK